jgi:hypothetical protein
VPNLNLISTLCQLFVPFGRSFALWLGLLAHYLPFGYNSQNIRPLAHNNWTCIAFLQIFMYMICAPLRNHISRHAALWLSFVINNPSNDCFDISIDKFTLDTQFGGPNGMLDVAASLAELARLLRTR